MNITDSVHNVRLLPAAAMRRGYHLLLRMVAIIAFASAVLVPAFAGDGQEGRWTGTWAAAPAFAEDGRGQ